MCLSSRCFRWRWIMGQVLHSPHEVTFSPIGCRNRMQGWESVRWLVIGITLPENAEIGSFLHKIDSCFLIEMKFTSKLFKKFRRRNESQEIPRLRLFIIFKNSSSRISKTSEILNFKNSKSGRLRFPESGEFSNFQILRYEKYFSKMFPHFLVFFEVNSWQIRGSRVHYRSKKCRNFRSSKIHLKSSGIDQESIISRLGII